MTETKPSAPSDGCSECPVETRRDFLMDALRASAAALAAIGLSSDAANAMPVRFVSALATLGEDKSYPVPALDGVQIDKGSEVILARTGKSVYAFALACPHQNTALKWDAAANRFQCPKHKSRYNPDGTFIEGRATRGLDRYAVKLVGANIVVDIDKLYQEDTDLPAWSHAFVTLS